MEKTKTHLLVTAVGEDRPGIVARMSELFLKHGGNLEESRMSILGGEFAAVILVTIGEENVDALAKALAALNSESIVTTTKRTQALSADRFDGHKAYEIKVSGADHEGIVYRVSSFLKDKHINIQTLDTEVVPAPMSASPLFQMTAIVSVPPSIDLATLKKHLEAIGNEECVDIAVSPTSAKQAISV